MRTEARYKNLQTDNFLAKNITADSITLKDTLIKSDVMMAGTTIKKLYEQQRDTNSFDNKSKETLESLNSTIKRNDGIVTLPPTCFKLSLLDDLNEEIIREQHATMCIDGDGNVIYVCKIKNKIVRYTLPMYEPHVKVNLDFDDHEQAFVNLKVI
jgi:hypothetical protein